MALGRLWTCHQVKRQLAPAGCFGLNAILTALLNATRPESSPKAALNVPDETISKCTRLLRVLRTIRTTFAIAAAEDLELRSVDISAAFTNGDLDEYIYMRQPDGFHEGGPNRVCKLKKSLYGLKQAARQWNIKLHSALTEMGFKRVEADRSVYIYSDGHVRIFVPIYIDDITFACKDGCCH